MRNRIWKGLALTGAAMSALAAAPAAAADCSDLASMALTKGTFSRMIADSAPPHLRATSFGAFHFVSGIATLLASLGAGLLWDRHGASVTFIAAAGVAAASLAMLSLLPSPARK